MHRFDLFVFEELKFLAVSSAARIIQTVSVFLGLSKSHSGVQFDFVWDVKQVNFLLSFQLIVPVFDQMSR